MILYRGDCDSQNIRKLRHSLMASDGLFTNLINSGNPFALNNTPLVKSIQQHVVPGWNTSHFLSFSKDKKIAEFFSGAVAGSLSENPSNFSNWTTVVVEVNLATMTHKANLAPGIDHYEFNEVALNHGLFPLNPMRQVALDAAIKNRRSINWPTIRNILTIDVYRHLSHLQSNGVNVHPLALTYSYNDQEVLILPIDPMYPGQGGGNTALIDMGAISKINFYN